MTKPKTPNPEPLTSNDVAIKVEGVYKSFKLPHEKSGSIKNALLGWRKRKRGYENQHVLKNVSFEIKKGEFFGIVGRNGSGKSTLLKLISQIYVPDRGSITVNGKLTPFIELGVGFNPELSGRDNVYLNGALLGFNREEMEAMYDEIVEFAELERFMDQKLKNYSSGMQVRLAFSIAIRANTDILVLDEVLAVGDEAFQRKCEEYFSTVKKQGKTIILVTHDMEAVRKYCDKVIMISNGECIASGAPDDVANAYSMENLESAQTDGDGNGSSRLIENFTAELISPLQISQDGTVKVKVSYSTVKDFITYVVCDIRDMDRNVPLITAGSKRTSNRDVSMTWVGKLREINNSNIVINLVVRDDNDNILYYLPHDMAPRFSIRRNDYPNPKKPTDYALLFDKGSWK